VIHSEPACWVQRLGTGRSRNPIQNGMIGCWNSSRSWRWSEGRSGHVGMSRSEACSWSRGDRMRLGGRSRR